MKNESAEKLRYTASKIRESAKESKRQFLRGIEYRRLKRFRKKEVPGYVYCKNCGTELKGMYCHRCGQYALDPEQPFWKYVLQYFENVYQFDGKVWTTLWMLFRRPGYLTTEFCAGKIASYVHPMKLLMFITVVFFLFFFMFFNGKIDSAIGSNAGMMDESMAINKLRENGIVLDNGHETRTVALISDSSLIAANPDIFRIVDIVPADNSDGMTRKDTVVAMVSVDFPDEASYVKTGTMRGMPLMKFNGKDNASKIDKVSLFKERIMGIISGYASLLALMLIPLLALMLKGFYRKSCIPYMGHFVFSLHFASFFFILLSFYLLTGELWKYGGAPFFIFVSLVLTYMTAASHWVYKGTGWFKAAIKSIFGLFIYFLSVTLIIVAVLAYLIYCEKDIVLSIMES